ncbi:DUF6415 family natural product biosynthesis protein [Streptomyces sp. NPDC101227]|uniref:DUF6415 family natural product biosynthesis protein n=1 Tax=Streptomyces sp. NPDC101227 TaxID=3366136 RepID=UPI0037F5C061
MSARSRQDSGKLRQTSGDPIDADTIRGTIRRALQLGSGRLDLSSMVMLEEELRGHIALLLPEAREAAHRRWPAGGESHQRRARFDGIEQQMKQGLGEGPLSAHVQVQQLTKDLQYLLVLHTAEARR